MALPCGIIWLVRDCCFTFYAVVGRSPVQHPASRIAGCGGHGLAGWQWVYEHGPRHQRAGTSAEDPRGLSQGVAGRPRTRGQGCILLTAVGRAGTCCARTFFPTLFVPRAGGVSIRTGHAGSSSPLLGLFLRC